MMKKYMHVLLALVYCLCAMPNAARAEDFMEVPVGALVIDVIRDANTTMEAALLPQLDKHPQFRDVFKNGPAPAVSQTYYLKDGDHQILIDAGWGKGLKIKGNTLKILKENGIEPVDITDILLTHLDMDHIGGLIENGHKAFPNATLWISEQEANAWQKGQIARRPDMARQLARSLWKIYSGQIKLFKYGEEILPGITAVDARGHTPGHTAFDIVSGNEKMTIGGDVMHIYQVQLQKPQLSTIYDMDMKKAAETRTRLLQRASEEKSIFGGMHFPLVSAVLKRADGGFMMREPR